MLSKGAIVPFYIRKAISVGPLRFNLSKSGIGLSFGVRGLRIGSGARGNYVHAGRYGLYYRKAVPGPTLPTANIFKSIFHSRRAPADGGMSRPSDAKVADASSIESSSALEMVDSTATELLQELNDKRHYSPQWPAWLVFAVALVGGAYWSGVNAVLTFGAAIAGCLACVWRYSKDQVERYTVWMYDLEPEVQEQCARVCAVFEALRDAGAVWHISSESVSSGGEPPAKSIATVQRTRITPSVGTGPAHFKTNVPVPRLPVGKQVLHFLPDRVLVEAAEGFGAVNYTDLVIVSEEVTFVESDPLPKDAKILDTVWLYQTKSGEPDRRYKDNQQLPVVLYERIHFRSASGLNEVIQVSRVGFGERLRDALVGTSSGLG